MSALAAIEREGGYVARWRVRTGPPERPESLTLHPDREAAQDHAAQFGGMMERLPWPVEVEAPHVPGLRPCGRCPTGWLRAVAGDAGPDLLCPAALPGVRRP